MSNSVRHWSSVVVSSSWRCERNKTINAEINFRGMSRPVVPVVVQAERGVPFETGVATNEKL